MRKFSILLSAVLLVVALAGCSSNKAAPSAKAVWGKDLASKAYKSWKPAPGYETAQPAKGPHGKMVQIFVDDNITKTLGGSATTAWPVGSTIVKDALDANSVLVGVEYMQKTGGGWYYASYDPAGTVLKEGVSVAPCAPCHSTGSDSVKSFKLP